MSACYPYCLTKGASVMSQPVGPSTKFKDMGIIEKLVFAGKLCLFLASFGFAFPLLLSD
jgi:hypothetical protein